MENLHALQCGEKTQLSWNNNKESWFLRALTLVSIAAIMVAGVLINFSLHFYWGIFGAVLVLKVVCLLHQYLGREGAIAIIFDFGTLLMYKPASHLSVVYLKLIYLKMLYSVLK